VTMDTASTEHAIARLAGLARLALRRHALLTATTKDTVSEAPACATLNTLAATVPLPSAPTPVQVLALVST